MAKNLWYSGFLSNVSAIKMISNGCFLLKSSMAQVKLVNISVGLSIHFSKASPVTIS